MNKLNRHYLFLLIAYGLLGPLLPALALFLMNDSRPWQWEWPRWAEDLGFYYVIGLAPALITGALVWALGLRRNRQGLNFTLAIALILAVALTSCFSQNWGDFSAVLLTRALTAGLLYRALPQPTVDYWPVTKLQRHYCFLFLGFTVLGPLLPGWVFLILLGGDGDTLDSGFLILSYGSGLLPALLTGALVWQLQLRRDARRGMGIAAPLGLGLLMVDLYNLMMSVGLLPALLTGALVWQLLLRRVAMRGIAATLGLSFLIAALYGVMMSGGMEGAVMGLYGVFAAMFFCPFLPAPDKQP